MVPFPLVQNTFYEYKQKRSFLSVPMTRIWTHDHKFLLHLRDELGIANYSVLDNCVNSARDNKVRMSTLRTSYDISCYNMFSFKTKQAPSDIPLSSLQQIGPLIILHLTMPDPDHIVLEPHTVTKMCIRSCIWGGGDMLKCRVYFSIHSFHQGSLSSLPASLLNISLCWN